MNIEDKFPDLLGKDENGKEVRLSSYPSNVRLSYISIPRTQLRAALSRPAHWLPPTRSFWKWAIR